MVHAFDGDTGVMLPAPPPHGLRLPKLARDGVHGIKAPPLDEEDGEHICRWLNCCFSVVNASSNTTSSDPHIVFVRPPMISSKVT
ncbi:hypothetical protein FQA47_014710 [Oryzias melastigma]|uniref:Uncharacterized protein n=1 Tax=Oryzias melastigma TaxID=30732 RepID=A0A834F4T2_ORYME|nr:hypothetical protein FQA47_014710 [Oryzias melastigma]